MHQPPLELSHARVRLFPDLFLMSTQTAATCSLRGFPLSGDLTTSAGGAFNTDTTFAASGGVSFHWANDVTLRHEAKLIDSVGHTINEDTQNARWYRIDVPVYQGDTTLHDTLATVGHKCGLTGKSSAEATAKTIISPGDLVVWELTQPKSAPDQNQPACRLPKPKFTMTTDTQTSGDGGTLTISVGYAVSLQSTTTDLGYPQASSSDLTWFLDQTEIATGTSASVTPGDGTHTVTLQITNGAGSAEATATIEVHSSDEAGSCDDPLTDVVESDCDGDQAGRYSQCGSTASGTRYCSVLDWYVWNENTQQYQYSYTEEVYCWNEAAQ